VAAVITSAAAVAVAADVAVVVAVVVAVAVAVALDENTGLTNAKCIQRCSALVPERMSSREIVFKQLCNDCCCCSWCCSWCYCRSSCCQGRIQLTVCCSSSACPAGD